MPTRKQRFLALLATSRAANLPTVATHVGVGFLLAFAEEDGSSFLVTHAFLIIAIAVSIISMILGFMFYVGGCFLGDAIDAQFDNTHRPERPIPQGLLPAQTIAVAGTLLLVAAWLISCFMPLMISLVVFGIPLPHVIPMLRSGDLLIAFPWRYLSICCGLAIAIAAYAKYHKSLGAWAPVLMALCRVLLVIWAAAIVAAVSGVYTQSFDLSRPVLVYASATFLYTLTLSLVARNESDPNAKLPGWPPKLLLILPPLLLPWLLRIPSSRTIGHEEILVPHPQPSLLLIIASLIFLAWCINAFTRLKHSIPAFVSAALAGFCLMDACFATLIGWPVAVACLLLFLLALLLQRIAPAT